MSIEGQEVVQEVIKWNEVITTFLGSSFAFIFGICLFYLSEYIKKRNNNAHLIEGLKKEFDYNLSQIDNWIEETDKVLRTVGTGDKNVFNYYRYSTFQRLFLDMCFQQGILYKSLTIDNLGDINAIVVHFQQPTSDVLNEDIQNWKESKISQVEFSRAFEFELSQLKKYKEQYLKIKEDIS